MIDVLDEFEALLKKDDREHADEEHERASCHLVDGDWGIEESHIHQLNISFSANWSVTMREDDGTVVPARSHAAGIAKRRTLKPVRGTRPFVAGSLASSDVFSSTSTEVSGSVRSWMLRVPKRVRRNA